MIGVSVWGYQAAVYYPIFWGGQDRPEYFNYVQSIYVQDNEISVALFVVNVRTHKIIPDRMWRSPLSRFDFVGEVKRNLDERRKHFTELITIINPDETGSPDKPDNVLRRILREEQIYAQVQNEFKPIQGVVTLWRRDQCDHMDYSKFEDWEKIQVEINGFREYQSSGLMAFLQGVVYCDRRFVHQGWL